MTVHDSLIAALVEVAPKPADDASREAKRKYAEDLSNAVARRLAAELHNIGLADCQPIVQEDGVSYGAERRLAGGIGAKKVDVSWSTDSSGLMLAVSIKSINFADRKTHNYQKNLTNRRGDMLFETVTLHRRFPFAVVAGLFMLDVGASTDGTARRSSTLENAHDLFRLFTRRPDPAGREEQLERLYIVLCDSTPGAESLEFHEAGCLSDSAIPADEVLSDLLQLLTDRNSDFYDYRDGRLVKR